jgi:transcriptional regulator with XRE-family HTH domain
MSLRQVAQGLGFSASYVSDIERGRRNPPDDDQLRRWAEIIGVDPADFISRAKLDRATVTVQVDRNPENTDLAMMFARRLPTMSEKEKRELRDFFAKSGD